MASVEATRRILEEQLRLVLEQKVLLENHLADLNTQPQPSALLPQKRSTPALGAASKQPSKRQRVRAHCGGSPWAQAKGGRAPPPAAVTSAERVSAHADTPWLASPGWR